MESGYIFMSNTVFPTLFAISGDEQARGLMYEESPTVMSFIYDKPALNRFWMSNTPSKLDIVFCCNGKIKQICKGEPYTTTMLGDVLSDLVVELPYGTMAQSEIKLGQSVGLVKPTTAELKEIIAKKYGNFYRL